MPARVTAQVNTQELLEDCAAEREARGSHGGELERAALRDQPALRWSLRNIETARCVSVLEIRRGDSC